MKYRYLFLVCSIMASISYLAAPPHPNPGQSQAPPATDSKLDKRISYFQTSGQPLLSAVVGLAYEYKLPMGIEYVDREATTRPIYLEFRNESLRTIFASIVAQLPEYRVDFFGEVVEIYSPHAREDSANLFNKPIKDFSVVGVDTRDADLELSCSLSRELKASAFCGGSITNGQWGPLKITVRRKNAMVYEILMAIVQQNGKAIWIVTTSPEKLSKMQMGGLWHIYPLEMPFKEVVLDKLESLSK
jgi:hypothetical protein